MSTVVLQGLMNILLSELLNISDALHIVVCLKM